MYCAKAGSALLVAAEQAGELRQRPEQVRRVELAAGRHFAVRRRAVDDVRQRLSEDAGHLARIDANLARQCADRVRAEHVLQRLGRNRLVLAGADPRADDVAGAARLELLDEAVQAARLVIDEFERGRQQRALRIAAGLAADQTADDIE